MPGNYTITTRASGTILTAGIYNADHQNHVDNNTPQGVGGYSSNQAQMQTQTDPGGVGSESLATSVAGELERMRFILARLGQSTFWYSAQPVLADSFTTVASASTTDLGAITATLVDISGTTTINSFGNPGATPGQRRLCRLTGAGLTITASGSIICPQSLNLGLLQNDYFEVEHLGSGTWFVTRVFRNQGGIVVGATAAQCLAGADGLQALTAAAFAGNKSLLTNGFYKFPGGLIIQWGTATIAGSTTGSVGFNVTFPGAPFAMWVSGQAGTINAFGANAISTSTFSLSNNDPGTRTFYWLAIGN